MAKQKPTKMKAAEKEGTTVYAPRHVAAALGGRKPSELKLACRIAAHLLQLAATEVAGRFSPAEWERLHVMLASREMEPEQRTAAQNLGDYVEDTAHLLREADAEDTIAVAARLRELSYVQAWAVRISIQFRKDYAHLIEPGAAWWTLSVREAILNPETASEE